MKYLKKLYNNIELLFKVYDLITRNYDYSYTYQLLKLKLKQIEKWWI